MFLASDLKFGNAIVYGGQIKGSNSGWGLEGLAIKLMMNPSNSLDFSFLFCEKATLDLAICRFLGHSDTRFPSWGIFIVVF